MDKTVIKVKHDDDHDIDCIYVDEEWYDNHDGCESFKSDLEDLDIYCDDEKDNRSGGSDDDDDDDDDSDSDSDESSSEDK